MFESSHVQNVDVGLKINFCKVLFRYYETIECRYFLGDYVLLLLPSILISLVKLFSVGEEMMIFQFGISV